MNSTFQKNIETYGGKHGGLISLQDNNLGDKVPSFHLLQCGERLTEKQKQELVRWSEKYGTDKLIIRTSHFGDWEGLVDVMPTYTDISYDNIDQALEKIQKELYDPRLIEYAKNEGIDFRPEDCTISIAPYLNKNEHGFGNMVSTITEHPNAFNTRHFMIDSGNYGGFSCRDYDIEDVPIKTRDILEKISEVVVGDDSIVCQIEASKIQGDDLDFLYQIRQFSQRSPHPLYNGQLQTKGEDDVSERFFGTTATRYTEENIAYFKEVGMWDTPKDELGYYNPESGMLKTVGLNQGDMIGERRNLPDYTTLSGEREYILYQSDLSEYKNGIDYHQPQGARIYLGGSSSPALSHMHTRYVKMVLQKEGGAAYLAQRGDIRHKVLYIMNGIGATGLNATIIPGKEAKGMYTGWM